MVFSASGSGNEIDINRSRTRYRTHADGLTRCFAIWSPVKPTGRLVVILNRK